ncbi:hypothetical protein ACM66B_005420 [Microbotryomycetes sp. NB124-2]
MHESTLTGSRETNEQGGKARFRARQTYHDPLQGVGAVYIPWQAPEPRIESAHRPAKKARKDKPQFIIPLDRLPPLPVIAQLPSPAPSDAAPFLDRSATVSPLTSAATLPSYATSQAPASTHSQKKAKWTPPSDRASPFNSVALLSVGLSENKPGQRQAQTASQAYLDLLDEQERRAKRLATNAAGTMTARLPPSLSMKVKPALLPACGLASPPLSAYSDWEASDHGMTEIVF